MPEISGVRGPSQPPPIVVTTRHDQKLREEVKKKLKEFNRPSEIGLRVKILNKIRYRGRVGFWNFGNLK